MQSDQTIRKRQVKQTCFFEIWCTKEYLLNHVVFRRFVSKRSQSIAIDEMVIKRRKPSYARELGYANFHSLNGWLDQWKRR